MRMRWLVAVLFVVTFATIGYAHEGHTHKILGTVTSVQGSHLDVKTTDGKVITITIDAKTAITRGQTKLDAAALKAGERVSVDYTQSKNVNTAKAVKLGEAPAAAKK